jgi:L-ascorbate metabolism protein UlaG (beta-lactamase superfamily)
MQFADINIDFTGHSGFLITCLEGKKVFVDPFNLSEEVVKEKADFILITHSHYDHCSIKDIERIVKPGSVIVCPPDVQSKITRIEGVNMQLIESGEELVLGKMKVEALAAYNTEKDREFHTKKDGWVGYVIKIGNVIIYHSGDSDMIKEMEKLSGYGKIGNSFIALLPVSGKYVMSAEEAAKAAKAINPNIAIPMHYGSIIGTVEDAQRFVKLCLEEGINAQILEKI